MTDLEIAIRKILDLHYAERIQDCDDECLCYKIEEMLIMRGEE